MDRWLDDFSDRGVLCTEPRILSLAGFELAQKGWQGGPVSTSATQSHQQPSHFRLSPYMNPTRLPIFSWPRPVPTHIDSSTRYSPSDGPTASLRPVRAPTHTGLVHTPRIYPAPSWGGPGDGTNCYVRNQEYCPWQGSNWRRKRGRVDWFRLPPRSLISSRPISAYHYTWNLQGCLLPSL